MSVINSINVINREIQRTRGIIKDKEARLVSSESDCEIQRDEIKALQAEIAGYHSSIQILIEGEKSVAASDSTA